MNRLQSVSVSGIGCVCAAGRDLAACMETLFSRAPIPAPPGFCPDMPFPVFEVPEAFLPDVSPTAPRPARPIRLALAALAEALMDARLEPDLLRSVRVGVSLGTNVAGGVSNRTLLGQGAGNGSLTGNPGGMLTPADRFLVSNPAQWISRRFGFSGPCQTIVNACSAGSDAIGLAGSWIRSGRCDAVIAGGVDALYEVTYHGFAALMNSDTRSCRPFDADRNGLNLGEGAGILILESEDFLSYRGKQARAHLKGYGMASDAYHFTAPDPDGAGLRVALRDAFDSAGLSPPEIAYINAHGTGTRDNDRIESRLFHDLFPGVVFNSTKGFIGHTLGAAGAIEAAFTVACLERSEIPASAGFLNPDPELPAHPVRAKTVIHGNTGLSETLAFGGNNSVLLFSVGRNK